MPEPAHYHQYANNHKNSSDTEVPVGAPSRRSASRSPSVQYSTSLGRTASISRRPSAVRQQPTSSTTRPVPLAPFFRGSPFRSRETSAQQQQQQQHANNNTALPLTPVLRSSGTLVSFPVTRPSHSPAPDSPTVSLPTASFRTATQTSAKRNSVSANRSIPQLASSSGDMGNWLSYFRGGPEELPTKTSIVPRRIIGRSTSPAAAAPIPIDDSLWVFRPPPNNQRTFFIEEDNIEFSSKFDSGNLIQVERLGPFRYNFYTSMDCGNSDFQTNNRQWFHFSVRGGEKGTVVHVNVIGMMHSAMYTYEWMPVMAIMPHRPAYSRLPGKSTVVALEAMPPTPGYPLLVHRDAAARRSMAAHGTESPTTGGPMSEMNDSDNEDFSPSERPGKKKAAKNGKKKKGIAMNLTFSFRIDVEVPLVSPYPVGHPDCHAIYIASNHPYPYSILQRNIRVWQLLAAGRTKASVCYERTSSQTPVTNTKEETNTIVNFPANISKGHENDIYFHREILCKTLEGRNVDLITISDMTGIVPEDGFMPMVDDKLGIPYSSSVGRTTRPRCFQGKQYIVLSARVHAGECPASHMMHGSMQFLLNATDPRAMALRRHFVILIVPMLNPDGVVRGHSRVDAAGVDLNRMYRNPSFKRHPAAYSLWHLLTSIDKNKLALYVDMHAHANKRGTFFYGNGMDAVNQVQNLLYAKLVALNTPYMDFTSCNYTDTNMTAVSRSGASKDSSCRVVLFTETGALHSYAIEASHVAGKTINAVAALPGIPGEEFESIATNDNASVPRYTPNTFGDTGKGILLGLLDLKGLNPVSRIPITPYQSVKGVALYIQRQLQLEIAEKLFVQAYKDHGVSEPEQGQTMLQAIMAKLRPQDIPPKLTLKACRAIPPTTASALAEFLSLELATSLLAQTPPNCAPRTLVCHTNNRNKATASAAAAAAAAAVGLEPSTPPPPPVVVVRKTAESRGRSEESQQKQAKQS